MMQKKELLQLLSIVTCLLLINPDQVNGKTKHVTVSLDAKWNQTPLCAEASEYMAKESSELFWEFVEHLSTFEEKHIQGTNQEEHYAFISKTAEKLLPGKQNQLFHFALSIRAHSPTVEMYARLARDSPLPDCPAFLDVHGFRSCDLQDLDKLLNKAKNQPAGLLLARDHVYHRHGASTVPGAKSSTDDSITPTVIVYGELGRDSFRVLHQMLKFYAERGKIQYIVRHYFKPSGNEQVRLSGYGVELAIKSQEYKAQDDTKIQDDKEAEDDGPDEVQGFVFSTLKKLHPDKSNDLKKFKDHLIASTNEVPTLKVWQLQDLSYQAASKIVSMSRDEQLVTLRDISQNFPLLAGQLLKTPVPGSLRKEIQQNQMAFQRRHSLNPGDSAMYLNGLQLDLDLYDAFSLVETLSSEVKLLAGLGELGLKGRQLYDVLQIEVKDQESSYALDIRDKSIMYVNDLEKDRRYSNWPRNLEDLLKPTFPGMLRHMARNMFHLIFVVDPAEKASVELLRMAEAFYVHNAPIRIGLLLVVNDAEVVDGEEDLGVALYRGFQYIASKEDYGKALSFLTDVYDRVLTQGWSVETVRSVLSESASSSKVTEILTTNKYDKGRLDSVDYFMRTGLASLPQVLMNGQPLRPEDLAQDTFEEAVVGAIMKATPELQRAVYNNQLTNAMSVLDWLMKQANVMPRLNQRVFSTKNKYLSYATKHSDVTVENSSQFIKLNGEQMTVNLAQQQKYLTKNDEVNVRPVTMSVVADYETQEGRQLLLNVLKHLKSSNQVRVGVVYNPGGATDQTQTTFWSRLIHSSFQTLPSNLAKQFLVKLLKSEEFEKIASGEIKLEEFEVHGMDVAAFQARMEAVRSDFLISHSKFCNQVLDMKPGQRAVLVNGRVIGPFTEEEVFSPDDFSVLEKHSLKTVSDRVEEVVSVMDYDEDESSDLIMKIAAQILGNPQSTSARKSMSGMEDLNSAVRILPDKKDSPFEIVAILDPLTRDAQRIAPLLIVLRELLDAKVTVYMNCKEKLSEMPLKNFYRYVLEPRLKFEGGMMTNPVARFTELPHALILTMNVDPPQGWLVEATRTPYDLDNIKLQEIGGSVTAWYELENLLLEGHCFDTTSGGSPPRGLQFTLGTTSKPVMVDTIVMANLGYFQLKANPGAWLLRLREGKSKEIYDIAGNDFTDSATENDDVIIVMDNFKSKIIKVKVAKKADKLKEDVLADNDKVEKSGSGIWDSISSSFSGKKKPEPEPGKERETLNIFSVASGHLYERFLRIMTLGVTKHTKSKVKFWFLKNYLSPAFKETIPVLAKHYGFEYELVQYKWPRWLHQQTEKQRIIWGYKILFLDVLFPLDVKKIIFVDADQIVRADLQELYDLDLEGAPYGYTPFCDSRTEMEGFRFWKSGYWASHLGHRKYHISALYVVDLVKFRRIAAGDRLRGQYQGLSQDPNSLSNLDQDLPNNMIHQVAIKSLPMEWLWCETWCSNTEKKNAKTIDLCNNPQTKEPKLVAARRIAPEWTEYDNEIKKLLDKKHHTLKSPSSQTSSPSSDEQETVRDEL